MFYICRFSDNWSLYDTTTNKTRSLEKEESDLLKKMFGSLLNDNSKMLLAAKVESISPNKLVQLPVSK